MSTVADLNEILNMPVIIDPNAPKLAVKSPGAPGTPGGGGPNRADLEVATLPPGPTLTPKPPAPATPATPATPAPLTDTIPNTLEAQAHATTNDIVNGKRLTQEEIDWAKGEWAKKQIKPSPATPAPGPATPVNPPPQTPTEPPPKEPPPKEPSEQNSTETTTQSSGDTTDQKSNNKTMEEKANDFNKDTEDSIFKNTLKHNLGDSLKRVLNIDDKTGGWTKALKYLLYGLSSFASGWVGKDDAIMQAAVQDFRAKRDADNQAEAKRLEKQEQLKTILAAYPGMKTSSAWKLIIDLGNAEIGRLDRELAERLHREDLEAAALEADKGRTFTGLEADKDRDQQTSERVATQTENRQTMERMAEIQAQMKDADFKHQMALLETSGGITRENMEFQKNMSVKQQEEMNKILASYTLEQLDQFAVAVRSFGGTTSAQVALQTATSIANTISGFIPGTGGVK
jgi:hypothetical protein